MSFQKVGAANQAIVKMPDAVDIAALVLFPAGSHARAVSGQFVPIDGDSKSTT